MRSKYNEEGTYDKGKSIIEMIRECKTKEQLFTVFEETSNNKMEFWDEDIYKAARSFLKQAMGNLKLITDPSMDIFQKRNPYLMFIIFVRKENNL